MKYIIAFIFILITHNAYGNNNFSIQPIMGATPWNSNMAPNSAQPYVINPAQSYYFTPVQPYYFNWPQLYYPTPSLPGPPGNGNNTHCTVGICNGGVVSGHTIYPPYYYQTFEDNNPQQEAGCTCDNDNICEADCNCGSCSN